MTTPTTAAPPFGVTIFGREPAAWAGLIESALALAFLLGVLSWTPIDTPAEVGVVMALVSAVLATYTAWATREVTVAILIGLLKAGVALGAVFGLEVSVETMSAAVLVVSAVFALVNRQVATPLADVGTGRQVVSPDGELLGGYR